MSEELQTLKEDYKKLESFNFWLLKQIAQINKDEVMEAWDKNRGTLSLMQRNFLANLKDITFMKKQSQLGKL